MTLRWEPEPLVAGAAATFRLSVANISDGRIALKSSSGQQAELTLLRGEDEVYRWSRGRAFTQAITLLPIDAGSTEEILLDEPALDVEPGSYRLVATLVAEPAAPPVETVVEVGEA
ncbi:MAG: hypothetical protein HYU28_07485 [Actinobacteria bacterium]|nr:hypothetical protein [Actinomycetota bacterium]